MSRFLVSLGLSLLLLSPAPMVLAQGQDSTAAERDRLVIGSLLPGLYSNANQSYFDRRLGREPRHAAYELRVAEDEAGTMTLALEAVTQDGASPGSEFRLHLALSQDKSTVLAYASRLRHTHSTGTVPDVPTAACELVWRRSAAEFVAEGGERCDAGVIRRLVLSEDQLWIEIEGMEGGDLELHRAREFECYADIPGVGGGRDEPYDRYGDLALHDQGGSVWFTSKEGRRLGVSMLLVDWPMNNYEGAFARDSLVVYVSEETDEGRQELGYAFTEPEADRIGINLKWMLVNCFMQSNEDVAPFM